MIHKDVLLPFSWWMNRSKAEKKQLPNAIRFLIQELLTVLACFLIGRAVLFDRISPFGIALYAALLSKRKGGMPAFLAVTAGMISLQFEPRTGGAFLAMLMVTGIWSLFGNKSPGWSIFKTAASVFLSLLASNTLVNFLSGYLAYEMLMGILESFIGFVMVFIFTRTVNVIWEQKKRQVLSGEEIICLCIFFSLLIIGFWDINILSFSVRNIFTILLILIAAHAGGAGLGAAIGITAGFMLSLASAPDPALMGNLAVCGLLAGTFKELGKPGTSVAFFLANIIMNYYINRSTYIILPFGEIAGAVLVFALIPQSAVSYLKQFSYTGVLRSEEQQHYGKRVQELTVGRLQEFAQVFKHLSKVFGRLSNRSTLARQEALSNLFDMVEIQICKSCPLSRSCWDRDFTQTYTGIMEMLSIYEEKGGIERKDIPGSFAKRCLNAQNLPDNLNLIFHTYRNNLKWQLRTNDFRQLVADQLEGVGQVVTELAAELDMDIRFRTGMEDTIRLELDKNGVLVKEVLVLEKPGGKTEVSIHKPACGGNRECLKVIEPIISKVMGKPMSRQFRECIRAGKPVCTLHLSESRQFEIVTGVERQPKKDSTICGDCYSFATVKDGKFMLALSDGMGSGARAAEESSAVISLLENFLEAGFDQSIAIKTINSILMLRSREEMYATADLCILDLVEGSAEFIKIGGVSSFIRRRDKVDIIRQPALPMGILEDVQLETITMPIQDEDMIIMVTDGVLDAFSAAGDGEQALAAFIQTLETVNPQELSELIMEEALFHLDGEAKDDMTVMTGRVWEPY
ncbi:MAG: stage II sporulation protein E [Clostridiales bacterium]|nr:stage II sporulation protein E [Clostridiales bacterium]